MSIYQGEDPTSSRSRSGFQLSVNSKMARVAVSKRRKRRALDFLIENEPERRLDIRLSYKNFLELDKKVHNLYGDKADTTVTIYTAPSTLHANAVDVLQMCIYDGVRAALDSHGKVELGSRFRGVLKIPDAGLVYCRPGFDEIFTVIIEVGVSESYPRLKADINLWMQDFGCLTGIILFLKEQPKFKYPSKAAMRAYSADDRGLFRNAVNQLRVSQPFGPYIYNAYSWFGTLDMAFVEIYRRDPNTGYVIRDGRMELQGDNANLGFSVGDLFPSYEEDIDGIHSEPIYLKTRMVEEFLGDGAVETARSRFFHALGKHSH
ncbi:hypothetical protein V1504DRAFT_487697 [Lipomyces starkeyi]